MSSPIHTGRQPFVAGLAVPFRLQIEQITVDPLLFEKVMMTANFRNPPFLNDNDTIGHSDGRKPVRDENRHFA